MNAVNFEIAGISDGWFDVKIATEDKEIEISASDAWGNDSPMFFLKMLQGILTNRIMNGYVVFDEEPGIYIVCLEMAKEVRLSILYSDLDDDECNMELQGELTRQEIEEAITDTEEMFATCDFSVKSFSKTVIRAFEEWSSELKIKEYEANWMKYPKQELAELKKYCED